MQYAKPKSPEIQALAWKKQTNTTRNQLHIAQVFYFAQRVFSRINQCKAIEQ